MNRYYANAYGRFTTPDPYKASGGPSDPQSWNRYAYTAGDPVNRLDPAGLDFELTCGGFGDGDGYASSNCVFIGINQGCGSGYVMTAIDGVQMPSPCDYLPVVPVFFAPPKVITLRVVDECIFPNGTADYPGQFTLEVKYQVLVNGQPVLGNFSLSSAGVNQVNETVTNTGGNINHGSGNWCLSTATCDMPGSLTPSGTFWDALAGGGTANQSFSINGQTIPVFFSGTAGLTTWQDVFNSKSVSVGNGAVKGNSSTSKQTVDRLPAPTSSDVHDLYWCQGDFKVTAVVKGELHGPPSEKYLWASTFPGCKLLPDNPSFFDRRAKTRVWFLREDSGFLRPTFDYGTHRFGGFLTKWEDGPPLPGPQRVGVLLLTPAANSDQLEDLHISSWIWATSPASCSAKRNAHGESRILRG